MVEFPSDDPGSLDRRALIRRAAIVGAAAWTAPVILDSLTAPAGALTASSCYLYVVSINRSGDTGGASAGVSPDLACATTPSGIPVLCGGSYFRHTLQTQAPVGTVTTNASYNPGLEYFNFTFELPAGSCSIEATGYTSGTSAATACQASPSLTATVGSPTSVNSDIPAAVVTDVRAFAYVVVACS